jgi:hypothetical protein
MKKTIVVLFVLLFVSTIDAYNVQIIGKKGSYSQININNTIGYTADNVLSSNYVLASDKIVYFSTNGNTTIRVFLSSPLLSKDVKIGLVTKKTPITIHDISINSSQFHLITPVTTQNFVYPTKFLLSDKITIVDLNISFDSSKITTFEEFDIILLNASNIELIRLDPFLSGYSYRYPITIQSMPSLENYIFRLDLNAEVLSDKNLFFWSNTLVNGNDVKFTLSDGTTQIKYNKLFWNEDLNARFDVNVGPVTVGSNIIYMYFGKTSDTNQTDGNVTFELYDTFEDGDYTGKPTWTVSGGTCSAATAAKYDGSYGFQLNSSADIRSTIENVPRKFWFYVYSGTSGLKFVEIRNTDASLVFDCRITNPNFACSNTTLGHDNVYTSIINNTWYKIMYEYKPGEVFYTVKLYTTDTNLLATAVKMTYTSTGFIPAKVRLYSDSGVTTYMDNIVYSDSNKYTFSLGALEYSNYPPDINLTTMLLGSVFVAGGSNYQIDFNVSDVDNNSLLVDMNYTTTHTIDTGLSIFTDKNTLDLNCDGNDFTVATKCSYLWTVPELNGNYYINVHIRDDFNIPDSNVTNYYLIIDSTTPILSNPYPLLPSNTYDASLVFNVEYTETNPYLCYAKVYKNGVWLADDNSTILSGKCNYVYNTTVNGDVVLVQFRLYDRVGYYTDLNTSAYTFYNASPTFTALNITPAIFSTTTTITTTITIIDENRNVLNVTGYWQKSSDTVTYTSFVEAVIVYASTDGNSYTYSVNTPVIADFVTGNVMRLRVTVSDGFNAEVTQNSNVITYSETVGTIVVVNPVVSASHSALEPTGSGKDVGVGDWISGSMGLLVGLGTAALVFFLIMKLDIWPIREVLILIFLFLGGNFLGAFGQLMNVPILKSLNGFMLGMALLVFWTMTWLLNKNN